MTSPTPESCRQWREQLGAMALGHLTPGEATAVRAHLDGCAACRAELAALEQVARLLPLADVDSLEVTPAPPSDLGDRVVTVVRHERELEERRRRRRLRGVLSGLAAAAVVVALVVSLTLASGGGVRVLALGDHPAGVSSTAAFDEHDWGTEIRLEVQGLPANHTYYVWMRRAGDGEHVPAGSFRTIEGSTEVTLATALPMADAVGIGISTDGGDTIMYGHLDESTTS
jgi:Putative zinc-finger/Anti-sigma-K factor rskA